MRILGIDYGEKRVGLAISSPVGFIAQVFQQLNVWMVRTIWKNWQT